jgi:hypothetical protein
MTSAVEKCVNLYTQVMLTLTSKAVVASSSLLCSAKFALQLVVRTSANTDMSSDALYSAAAIAAADDCAHLIHSELTQPQSSAVSSKWLPSASVDLLLTVSDVLAVELTAAVG